MATMRRTAVFLLPCVLGCGGLAAQSEGGHPDASAHAGGDASPSDGAGDTAYFSFDVGPALDARLGAEDAPDARGLFVDAGDGLPSTQPCLTGGNVLWLDTIGGHSFWGEQELLVSAGSSWSARLEQHPRFSVEVWLDVQTAPEGPQWTIGFTPGGYSLHDKPIPVQTDFVYRGVEWDGLKSTVAGMVISETASTCKAGRADFRVDAFKTRTTSSGDVLELLTMAFLDQCDGAWGKLRGCLHYAAGP